jgi:hypothetical protein
MAIIKKKKKAATNPGQDTGEKEPFHTVGGNVN